jgi:molecular chaperone GrpE
MSNIANVRDTAGPTRDAAQFAGDSAAAAEESTPGALSLELREAALQAEKADMDNYKKRLLKEMGEHETRAREMILRDFLEVADNLERAIASWKGGGERDVKSIRDGVDMVLRLFKSKLERHSVTAIEVKGQPFDPRVHHAISQVPSTEAAPGTVLHEAQKGYRAGERLLRPAAVVVASAPLVPPPETSRPAQERSLGGNTTSWGGGPRRNWR